MTANPVVLFVLTHKVKYYQIKISHNIFLNFIIDLNASFKSMNGELQ